MLVANFVFFIATTILLVLGQALWKVAANQLSGASSNGVYHLFISLISNIPFLTGCVLYVLATGMWIYLLGQYEYSKIYPVFVGTCIIISLIVGYFVFGESKDILLKILGSVFIIIGVSIIAKG